jgi:hypothetical protein
MKLYELTESDDLSSNPMRVATTAALAGIKAKIEDTGYKGEYKVKSLLHTLRKHGISLNKEELIKSIKQPPWSNLIADIKGDRVIFKGEAEPDSASMDPDETTGTLEKMADRAGKAQENPLG